MNDTQAAAVASVGRRGFHHPDSVPPLAKDAQLMAQFLRLVEEVGELGRALRKSENIADEAADVLIVLYQIASMQGVYLESAVLEKLEADEQRGHLHGESVPRVHLVEEFGQVGGVSSAVATANRVVAESGLYASDLAEEHNVQPGITYGISSGGGDVE